MVLIGGRKSPPWQACLLAMLGLDGPREDTRGTDSTDDSATMLLFELA